MRVARAFILAVAFAVPVGVVSAAAASGPPRTARAGLIDEQLIAPSYLIYFFGIVGGADAALWLDDQGCTYAHGHCGIARYVPGTPLLSLLVTARGLAAGALPYGLVLAPDGDVWFADEGRRPAIGRITPEGQITEFRRGLAPGSLPFELTVAHDGDVWFTDQGTDPAIGRITPSGGITEYRTGLQAGSSPFGITTSQAGTIWFTDHGCNASATCELGHVGPGDTLVESTDGLRSGSLPLAIAAGPGDTVWFADASGAIGRIDADGSVSELTAGLPANASPIGIAAGPDGRMWFTDDQTPAIGAVSLSDQIQEYRTGLQEAALPSVIAPAADGKLWFTDENHSTGLGSVGTGVGPAVAREPVIAGARRAGGVVRCAGAAFRRWSVGRPSLTADRYDGYRWSVGGRGVRGADGRTLRLTTREAHAKTLQCTATASYAAPLNVAAVAVSRA